MRSIIESVHASGAKLRRGAGAARDARARRLASAGTQDRLHQPQYRAALRRVRADLGHGLRPHLDRSHRQPGHSRAGGTAAAADRTGNLLQAAGRTALGEQRRPRRGDRGGRPFGGNRPVRPAGLEDEPRAFDCVQRPARPPDPRPPAVDRRAARTGGPVAAARNDPEERRCDRRSRLRRDRAGKPACRAGPSCGTARRAAGGTPPPRRRKRQHRHPYRRASGRSGRNLEHRDPRPAALRNAPRLFMRPLDGITVVALEQVIAGPFATRQLAELGARVIKIERPGGGDAARGYDRTVKGLSSHFVWTNRSKESLALDVKHPAASEILQKLVATADVFLQNLAPGAVERLGLGAETLRKKHPRLVWCGISGYGPTGPYARKKAYDLLVQCEAGLLSVTGGPDAPAKAGIPVADIAAGMYAFSAVLAALIRRERTGEG